MVYSPRLYLRPRQPAWRVEEQTYFSPQLSQDMVERHEGKGSLN